MVGAHQWATGGNCTVQAVIIPGERRQGDGIRTTGWWKEGLAGPSWYNGAMKNPFGYFLVAELRFCSSKSWSCIWFAMDAPLLSPLSWSGMTDIDHNSILNSSYSTHQLQNSFMAHNGISSSHRRDVCFQFESICGDSENMFTRIFILSSRSSACDTFADAYSPSCPSQQLIWS